MTTLYTNEEGTGLVDAATAIRDRDAKINSLRSDLESAKVALGEAADTLAQFRTELVAAQQAITRLGQESFDARTTLTKFRSDVQEAAKELAEQNGIDRDDIDTWLEDLGLEPVLRTFTVRGRATLSGTFSVEVEAASEEAAQAMVDDDDVQVEPDDIDDLEITELEVDEVDES